MDKSKPNDNIVYRDKQDYLENLAYEFGIDYDIVAMYAEKLEASEDFNELVTSLEHDFVYN